MSTDFVDIHQHLLWGLDDGAQSPQVMRKMLRSAQKQRIRRIYATPHVAPGIRPFDAGAYRERLAEARGYAARCGIELLPGAEVAWTYQTVDALRQGRIPTLNGTEQVLLEFWPGVRWQEVDGAVRQVLSAGFVPVLAHVERYRCFFWNLHWAEALKRRYPVRYQVNAASLLGRDGLWRRACARCLVSRHLADAVGSDAHNCGSRPIELLAAYRWLKRECGAREAYRLTHYDGGQV